MDAQALQWPPVIPGETIAAPIGPGVQAIADGSERRALELLSEGAAPELQGSRLPSVVVPSGLDAADDMVLVVSARDGPMPGTRDGVLMVAQAGSRIVCVLLTSVEDLMWEDEDLIELVEVEVRGILSEYGFQGDDIPFIRGSRDLISSGRFRAEVALAVSRQRVEDLSSLLGPRITAYVLGLSTLKELPSDGPAEILTAPLSAERLRMALRAARLVVGRYDQDTARMWFFGMNTDLGGLAPAGVLRNAEHGSSLERAVLAAAQFAGAE
jgi:hypothetical protein